MISQWGGVGLSFTDQKAEAAEPALQKSVGSPGEATKDLQDILEATRQPLSALLDFIFGNEGAAGLMPAKVVPACTVSNKPKLARIGGEPLGGFRVGG